MLIMLDDDDDNYDDDDFYIYSKFFIDLNIFFEKWMGLKLKKKKKKMVL